MFLNLESNEEEIDYRICSPNGHITKCSTPYKDILIMIAKERFPGDLMQFDLSEFDVILGMNWLTTHGARIDCKALKVILRDSKGQKVCFYGD